MERRLTPQEIEKHSLNYFKNWYKEEKNMELIPPAKGERGFDLKTPDNLGFYEVKGTTTGTTYVSFRQFTNREYEKALECKESNLEYGLVVVFKVGSDSPYHYILSASDVIELAKEQKMYKIPLRRTEIEKWKNPNLM